MSAESIQGKTALITGASKRIGRETALTLAGLGINIVVHFNRSDEEARELARQLRQKAPSLSWSGAISLPGRSFSWMGAGICMNTAMDRILIKGLMLRCVLGITDEERREKQDVLISLVLWADLRPVAASDNVDDAVDYRAIKKRIIALVEASHYHLAEALADRIASLCLEHPRVQQVQVTLEKPTALRFAHSVGVVITRSRS